MFFYKKPEAVCKHLVFSDTVLYNNKVCQKDGKLNAEKRDDAARERAVPVREEGASDAKPVW